MTDPDALLRLSDAAAAFFGPDSGFTAASLRNEARHGRLAIWKIAGKYRTTINALREMQERCRLDPKDLGSGCAKPNVTPPAVPLTRPYGSSEMDAIQKAQDAARTILAELKQSCGATSRTSTSTQPQKAPVIPLKSR